MLNCSQKVKVIPIGFRVGDMQVERTYYCQVQKDVRITKFCWHNWKICQGGRNITQKLWRGLMIRKDILKNALKDIANRRTKRQSNSTKFRVLVWMITKSRKKELESIGELSQVCSQIVLKCLYLARNGRPDTLWSVNKLARSVTKWTQACDRRLTRLISYIHDTSDYRQYCHVSNTAQHCRLGLCQDSDFAGDLEDSK